MFLPCASLLQIVSTIMFMLFLQVIPLAAQFRDLHSDITSWMRDAEQEVQQKAVTPDQIKQRQQANKVLSLILPQHVVFKTEVKKFPTCSFRLGFPAILILNHICPH